jgi:hypothetical protein
MRSANGMEVSRTATTVFHVPLRKALPAILLFLPWRLIAETEKFGESRPSLFSRISVVWIGTFGAAFYNTLG